MDLDKICKLDTKIGAEEEDDDDDETFNMSDGKAPEPVQFDTMNDLAVQLKSMSMQIGEFGDEYLKAAMLVQDASREIRSAFRKANDKKIKQKQSAARQSLVSAFVKK